jgi:hypothetical protein
MGQEAAEEEFKEKKRKKEELKRLQAKSKLPPEELVKQQDEESSSFWLNNVNSPNVYHSFTKGISPWARSSAFTQNIQNTRGAFQFYQNAYNSPLSSKFVNAIEEDKKLREELKNKEKELENLNCNNNTLKKIEEKEIPTPTEISKETIDKIFKGCAIRGWIGLRQLKVYLRNLSAHKSDIINRNDFKYFLAKQAVLLNDNDINSIFAVFDKKRNDYINYIEFLNSITSVNELRKAQIESFKEQVKAPGQNYILFSTLMSLIDMNFHP